MSVVQFQCPSCQAPLRLQNRALFVGRTFDCPDCRVSLLIEAEGSTGVKAKPLPRSQKPARSASEGSASASAVAPSLALRVGRESAANVADLGVSLKPPMSAWDRLSRRPAALGWIVAALFAVILLIVVNPGHERAPSAAAPAVAAQANSQKTVPQNQSLETKSVEQNPKLVAEADPLLADTASSPDAPKPGLLPVPLPAESPAGVEPPRVVEKPPTEEPKPAVPPAPAALSPEAVEAKLRQKIARFDQPKPVPFVKVLDTVEELAGVPIVWDLDRVDDEQLQKPVTLQLKQTTVGEMLDALLQQVGLERRTVEGRIELRPAARKD